MITATAGREARAKQRFSLAAITERKKTRVPLRILMNGIGGVGKTSFAAQFPSPIFIQSRGESGLQTLESAGLASASIMPFEHDGKTYHEAQTWDDVLDAVEWLRCEDHGFKTIVFDVINGVEKLLFEHVCRRDFGGDWGEKGFHSYGKGFEVSSVTFKELTINLDRLRTERGMTCLMLCHSTTRTVKNPLGADYDRYTADMNEKCWHQLYNWCDIVLFANREVNVRVQRGSNKGKADSIDRVLHTDEGPAWFAKNRHNLPPEISMGSSASECYANFVQAMKESITKGGE